MHIQLREMFRLNNTRSRERFGAVVANNYLANPHLISSDANIKFTPGPTTKNGYRVYDMEMKTGFLDIANSGRYKISLFPPIGGKYTFNYRKNRFLKLFE